MKRGRGSGAGGGEVPPAYDETAGKGGAVICGMGAQATGAYSDL